MLRFQNGDVTPGLQMAEKVPKGHPKSPCVLVKGANDEDTGRPLVLQVAQNEAREKVPNLMPIWKPPARMT